MADPRDLNFYRNQDGRYWDLQDDPFGMIKLGSRTELVLPAEEGLEIRVQLGDNVIAGTSVLASYAVSKGELEFIAG